MGSNTNRTPYPLELRERAVRIVREQEGAYASRWAALGAIADTFGCTPETLRTWLRQAERGEDAAAGMTSSEQERLKELERETDTQSSALAL